MDPLSSSTFWRRLDERVDRRLQRVARTVRGLVVSAAGSGLRLAGTVAARAGETLHDIEIAQHFGFASVPPAGTEVVAVPVGGVSAHRVVVAELDGVTRPKDLLAGEAAIYSATGAKVHAKMDGSVVVSTPAGVVVQVTAAGQVLLAGGGAPVARVGDTVTITASIVDMSSGSPVATSYAISGGAVIATGSTLVQAGG